jgi:hypothetical protein
LVLGDDTDAVVFKWICYVVMVINLMVLVNTYYADG